MRHGPRPRERRSAEGPRGPPSHARCRAAGAWRAAAPRDGLAGSAAPAAHRRPHGRGGACPGGARRACRGHREVRRDPSIRRQREARGVDSRTLRGFHGKGRPAGPAPLHALQPRACSPPRTSTCSRCARSTSCSSRRSPRPATTPTRMLDATRQRLALWDPAAEFVDEARTDPTGQARRPVPLAGTPASSSRSVRSRASA